MAVRDRSARNDAVYGLAPDFEHNRLSDPPPLEWLDDDVLDDEERKALGQVSRPRLGLDGRLSWPLEEIRGVGHD